MTAMTTVAGRELPAEEWFERYPDLEKPLFKMRIYLHPRKPDGSSVVTIRAYEGPFCQPNHTRLYCSLTLGTKPMAALLFPRERFYVGIPGHLAIDSREAKDCVLSLFSLKPGDTDAEFFECYTPGQLAFVQAHGEELDMVRRERFPELNR